MPDRIQTPVEKASRLVEVLVVEDSATQRELLKHVLEEHDYIVRTASSGPAALAAVATSPPAMIISDIVMPGMDGYELCRQLKSDPHLHNAPVILLTALKDSIDVIRGLQCGADSFIVKPFAEDDLLRRLDYIVANRNLRDGHPDEPPMEIVFGGQTYRIHSDRRQILDLLLSTYEAAVRKNDELLRAQEELRGTNAELLKAQKELTAANSDLERKVSERTAKLEETNKALESFCYTVAHDLRAPLRGIQGFTSLLFDDYGELFDESARDYAQRVKTAARQMDQLISDLLSYGHVSQAELPKTDVSLEEELDVVLDQLNAQVLEKSAVVQVERPLPHVQANATLLEQILANLLSNALKFTKPGVPPRIRVWAERNGHSARLHVQDNGIGFDPQYADRIFGIFQRLHDSRKYPGTGIGLVIVRKGVERMGGKVGVESRVGEGSLFWIELPVA